MELSVKAIKFDATEKLQEFVQKKVSKLEKFCGEIVKIDVALKVVKPSSAQNKQVALTVSVPGEDLFVEKTCDTFEEAVDQCVPAMEKQLGKYKEKLAQK